MADGFKTCHLAPAAALPGFGEPAADQRRLVPAIVVEDEMHGERRGDLNVDGVEEQYYADLN
jgi:hypothetical protein